MAKRLITFGFVTLLVIIGITFYGYIRPKFLSELKFGYFICNRFVNCLAVGLMGGPKCALAIPRIQPDHDEDRDGILDADDILAGARQDAANYPKYVDAYYRAGILLKIKGFVPMWYEHYS